METPSERKGQDRLLWGFGCRLLTGAAAALCVAIFAAGCGGAEGVVTEQISAALPGAEVPEDVAAESPEGDQNGEGGAEPEGFSTVDVRGDRTGVPTVLEDRPNIVVFMTDDQRIDQMMALPLTQQRIFDVGMDFSQSVVNVPVCCPSRTTFLTGQHASHHGVLKNHGENGGFESFENQEQTLATALSEAGYHTIFSGKYMNGFGFLGAQRYTPPGWSDFHGFVAPTEVLYHSPGVWDNGELVVYGEDTHPHELLTTMMVESVDEAPDDRPFFMWVNYPAPHAQAGTPVGKFGERDKTRFGFLDPPIPLPQHVGMFADAEPWSTPNVGPPEDKPDFVESSWTPTPEVVREFHQAALESLISVDESVADIMDRVEALDTHRDTWFIFTSDNGVMLGEHGFYGTKYLPYEETVRVPLGITGPGVAATSTSMVVSNVDLAPTIVDIAEATPPRAFDGRSLYPILTGSEAPSGRAVLIEGFERNQASVPYSAVHTGDSVYIEWSNGEREMYDLVNDPHQLRNLVRGNPSIEVGELLERNRRLLKQLRDCSGFACTQVGSELSLPSPPPE